MDKNKKWVREQRVMRTIDNLKKNNMEAYFAEDKEVLLKKIRRVIKRRRQCGSWRFSYFI
jgi:N-glycosylase/DNA lyase